MLSRQRRLFRPACASNIYRLHECDTSKQCTHIDLLISRWGQSPVFFRARLFTRSTSAYCCAASRTKPSSTVNQKAGIDPIPHSQAASSKVQTDVSGFEVRGVTLFSEAKVVAVLKDCIGRSLTTSGIHTTANRLMLHYRNGGY
jgi:hypothetical protein